MDLHHEDEWACGFCTKKIRPCDRCILPRIIDVIIGFDDGITPDEYEVTMG